MGAPASVPTCAPGAFDDGKPRRSGGRFAPDELWPAPSRRLLIGAGLATLAGLGGCASKPDKNPGPVQQALQAVLPSRPAEPARVVGNVIAAADLNPSVSNRPSPLVLRLYELRAEAAFTKADFVSLYNAEQATLGADLLAREEWLLQPGQSMPLRRTLSIETRHLGLLAAYRNLERAIWRTVAPVIPNKVQQLTVRAESLALSMSIELV